MHGPTPPVTPHGVRDGEPASLAGLAQRRSGSVLDYARHACGERNAMDATAESFARFRGAVVAADDLRSLAPDALLLSCTRNASAAFVPVAGGGGPACHATPHLIVGRFEATNTSADAGRLARHLETCATCTERAAAFDRAERAFRAPHPPAPGGVVVARVIAALEAAAPIRWQPDGEGGAVVTRPSDDDTYDHEALPDLYEDEPFPEAPAEEETTELPAVAAASVTTAPVHGPLADDLGRRVLVPAGIVTVSVALAMGIAGVFGGTEPTPARGSVGLPAPTPPDRPPLADERTQERAARAARAALRRIEVRDRLTTRRAEQQRAAERAATTTTQTPDPTPEPSVVPGTVTPPAATAPQGPSDDGSSIETVTPDQGNSTPSDAPVFEPGP